MKKNVCRQRRDHMRAVASQVHRFVGGTLDFSSQFYRNCRSNRQRKQIPKCCQSCPFRTDIERAERETANDQVEFQEGSAAE